MRIITIKGKQINLLNQQEKAKEIGIDVRSLRHRVANGKMQESMITIPGSTKAWYLQEGETL